MFVVISTDVVNTCLISVVNTSEIKSLKFLDLGKITNYNENKSNGRYTKKSSKK